MSNKVITLEMLLAKKQQSNDDKLKKIYFKSDVLGGTIEVVKQRARDILRLMDNQQEDSREEAYKANCKLILKHCPIFREKELQETYQVAEPYEVILPIFEENLGEINRLAETILGLYGLTENKPLLEDEVEEVKN